MFLEVSRANQLTPFEELFKNVLVSSSELSSHRFHGLKKIPYLIGLLCRSDGRIRRSVEQMFVMYR